MARAGCRGVRARGPQRLSDASDHAVGVVIDDPVVTHPRTFAPLTVDERATSSTWRELAAVLFGVRAYAPQLSGRVVRWSTDNQAAASILDVGSRQPHLQTLAVLIHQVATLHGFTLSPIWVPREWNTDADAMSRCVDINDWGLTPAAIDRATLRWGPFVIDLFADPSNAKAPAFFAARPAPGAKGVDALVCPWPLGLCYACPPWPLLGRVFRRLLAVPADAVVVVPLWPSQPWWPILCPDGVHTRREVLDLLLVDRSSFELGITGRPDFLTTPSWRFTALLLRWCPAAPVHKPAFCLARWRLLPCTC